jgi:hypothetical protein
MTRATFHNSLRAAADRMAQEARQRKWRDDPVAWAEDVLEVVLWSKQKEILRSIAQNRRTAVKSCHSIGKTYTCALAAAWWISTREDCMVQSTAPTYAQVHGQLWEGIRKLHVQAGLIGRTTMGDQWLKPMLKGGRATDVLVGEGKKPADTNIHGFHGTHRPDGVFSILDEGCGIATPLFTGAEAITTANMDRQLTTGNPDDPNTEFGRIFREGAEQWNLITVSAFDTPLYTGEDKELLQWRQSGTRATRTSRGLLRSRLFLTVCLSPIGSRAVSVTGARILLAIFPRFSGNSLRLLLTACSPRLRLRLAATT